MSHGVPPGPAASHPPIASAALPVHPDLHVMPVIFLSFRPAFDEVVSRVTMGALLCMLLVWVWLVQLIVPTLGLSGLG
jgi:hypothetical protein